MNWTTDPASRWVAVYRVIVLILLLLQSMVIVLQHGEISHQVAAVETVVGVATQSP